MAGKTTLFATDFLQAMFQAVFSGANIVNLFANSSTSVLTNLYISLHTSDPGVGGNQTTNEISYTGYARVAVARTSGGFTVTNNSVSPAADIVFGTMTGGTGGTATFFGIGSASSGAGELFYSGAINPTIAVANTVTPTLTTGSTVTES